ncbi:MAG: pentapeptide repeat-containing protein [Bacteroidota bacterium]
MLNALQIGQRISEARKENKLSQAQLADKISISPQAVGKWERGESLPDIIMLNRIAQLLNVSLNYFSALEEKSNTILHREKHNEIPITKENWNLSSGNWVNADFSGIKNLQSKFQASNIKNCKFIGAHFDEIHFRNNNIALSNFNEASITAAEFSSTNIAGSSFESANINGAKFSNSFIKNCQFDKADLRNVQIVSCGFEDNPIKGAKLQGIVGKKSYFRSLDWTSDLEDAVFEACTFHKVCFNDVVIKNSFFRDCSFKKVEFANCSADRLSLEFLRLCGVDISLIHLVENF